MNENYIQNQTVMQDPDSAVYPDLSSVSGNYVSTAPGAFAVDGMDPSTEGTIFDMVSGGDTETILPDQEAAPAESVIMQDLSADIVPYLQKIDYTLTAILALLVFRFCFERIRSGLKGFTGRGLKD